MIEYGRTDGMPYFHRSMTEHGGVERAAVKNLLVAWRTYMPPNSIGRDQTSTRLLMSDNISGFVLKATRIMLNGYWLG